MSSSPLTSLIHVFRKKKRTNDYTFRRLMKRQILKLIQTRQEKRKKIFKNIQ